MAHPPRSTPPGEHRPVLLDEVLAALAVAPGAVVVDCTVGWAGHAVELLRRAGPAGRLIGLDLDADNPPRAPERPAATGPAFSLHHGHFAPLPAVRAAAGGGGGGRWRLHPSAGRWELHAAARAFQALRILVNRELANLDGLLRVLPEVLRPGGAAAIISFHSGEDRRVKAAFRDGLHAGVYAEVSDEPLRAGFAERQQNPRSRSAKLRWARRRLLGA